jgi:protease-4
MLALPWERVQRGSVLKIILQGRISDQLSSTLCDPNLLSLPEICDNFLKATYDPRILAVYLHIHTLNCGWAKLDEIRRQISNFRKSGKLVVAYLPFIGPKEYYIACACDEIFAPPVAAVSLFGFAVNNYSFGRGWYHNPYDDFEVSREALTALVDNIHSNWVDKVSSAIGKRREEVENFMLKGLYEVDTLKEEGFISSLAYDDQIVTFLEGRLGVKSFSSISFTRYSHVRKWTLGLADAKISMAKELIAIIRASGSIGSYINAKKFIEEIRMLKASCRIKAVIIRIDCADYNLRPSKQIWEEIRSLAAQKPVIASMSDVAASAGYYIAMGAGTIVAENLTITGSIGGAVTQNLNLENLYEPIHLKEIVRRGTLRSTNTLFEELFAREDHDYIHFRANAALSRSMTIDKLEEVAHGRVWTGKDALSHGLVDAIGGISRAIAIAKLKANIPQNRQVTVVELSISVKD